MNRPSLRGTRSGGFPEGLELDPDPSNPDGLKRLWTLWPEGPERLNS